MLARLLVVSVYSAMIGFGLCLIIAFCLDQFHWHWLSELIIQKLNTMPIFLP